MNNNTKTIQKTTESNGTERKSLQELTLKDNFMFGAVMLDPEICRETLERILGIKISRVEVSREKSIVYNPEYKGVRLDIYAEDEKHTHYDVEMQALPHASIEKRARYYHSQIDMELLLSGTLYSNLPDTYVIFICDFDPMDQGKYRYTQKKICEEIPELSMADGAHTIFLNTKGTNDDEVSPDLVRFLKYVGTPLSDSEKDFEDAFIQKLQSAVREIKASREMGARYMTFLELLNDERETGRKEGQEEERKQIARNMLEQNMPVKDIIVCTGLTEEQIQNLKQNNV